MRAWVKAIVIAGMEAGARQNADAADVSCAPAIEAITAQSKAARYSVRSVVTTQTGAATAETMFAPEGMYIKLEGKWTRNPIRITADDRAKEVAFAATTISECKALGQESVAGAPTLVYGYKQRLADGPLSENKLWIGTSDGLPRKFESRSSAGNAIILLRYGADLNMPVK